MATTSKCNNDLLSKRRRFQPPITTFFSREPESNACSSHLSHNHYSAATHSPTPLVPAKVQASLLSVGMRVRKSVAEGYKTHQVKMEEMFPTIKSKDMHPVKTTTSYSTPRSELAPFCGMSKSDHSVQPFSRPQPQTNLTADYNRDIIVTDDADTFSLPPSSQETVASSYDQQAPTALKRSYEFDDGDDDFLEEEFNNGPLPQATLNTWQDPLHSNPITPATVTPMMGRTILSPTLAQQRRRFIAATQRPKAMDIDDFEEPSFLRRREEVDMDYEIQMGGV